MFPVYNDSSKRIIRFLFYHFVLLQYNSLQYSCTITINYNEHIIAKFKLDELKNKYVKLRIKVKIGQLMINEFVEVFLVYVECVIFVNHVCVGSE